MATIFKMNYFFVIVHVVFQNTVATNHFRTMIIINIRNVRKAWLSQTFNLTSSL